MNRILCGGLFSSFLLLATPAMAIDPDAVLLDGNVDASTEVITGWSRDRLQPASRAEAMRPIGVTRSAQQAVEYLRDLAKAGATGYWSQCLRLADDAYMPRGPRLATAFAQWDRAKRAGVAHRKDRNPPPGAQMFWDPGHSAGHIATYVGNGKAVTNMPDGSVDVIEWREMNEWGPYLGWAPAYYQ